MKLYIDADGCPVTKIALRLAEQWGVEAVLVADNAHLWEEGIPVITVDRGADSADLAIANRVAPGDLVVTQDYGLAALVLARRGTPIHQDGFVYREESLDSMLYARHTARKIRQAGGRLRGPSKRTREQDQAFARCLEELLRERRTQL